MRQGKDALFSVPGQPMDEDVFSAAQILRGFVSKLDTPPEAEKKAGDEIFFTDDVARSTPSAEFAIVPAPAEKSAASSENAFVDSLLEQAHLVSDALEEGAVVDVTLEVASPGNDASRRTIRLREKGQATKQQLKRARRLVQLRTQS